MALGDGVGVRGEKSLYGIRAETAKSESITHSHAIDTSHKSAQEDRASVTRETNIFLLSVKRIFIAGIVKKVLIAGTLQKMFPHQAGNECVYCFGQTYDCILRDYAAKKCDIQMRPKRKNVTIGLRQQDKC